MFHRNHLGLWIVLAATCLSFFGAGERSAFALQESKAEEPPDKDSGESTQPDHQAGQTESQGEAVRPEPAAALRPRLEVHVPSVRGLIDAARRSRSGVFAAVFEELFFAGTEDSVDVGAALDPAALLQVVADLPDTSLTVYVFAPDVEERSRFAVQLDWPIADLQRRIELVLSHPGVGGALQGVRVGSTEAGGFDVAVQGRVLAHALSTGAARSLIVSHRDLPVPSAPPHGVTGAASESRRLLAVHMNVAGTEADSGGTVLSTFSFLTSIGYTAEVGDDGLWHEDVTVNWPMISGVGVKAMLGQVKQTFYVPDEAMGAVVLNAAMGPGMLEGLVGFGPQLVMEAPGQMTLVGEGGIGPIVSSIDSELCIALLPGAGFLPMPDVVIQARIKNADAVVAKLRQAAQKANQGFREREMPEPWHHENLRGRSIFFNDGSTRMPGAIMPLVLRAVLFTSRD